MPAQAAQFFRKYANLILIVGSLAFTLLTAELALRCIGYNPMNWDGNGRASIIRKSDIPQIVYEAAPGTSGHVWDADVQINSHGFRDREFPAEKPTGVKHVLVLGDSVAFGIKLPAHERFSDKLQVALDKVAPAEYVVMNLAMGGYDTLQEVATLEHRGLPLEPDIVVLAYCFNDIGIASVNLEYIRRLERYRSSPIYQSRLAQFVQVRVDRISEKLSNDEDSALHLFLKRYSGQLATIPANDPVQEKLHHLENDLNERHDVHRMTRLYTSPGHVGRLRYAFDRLAQLQNEHTFRVIGLLLPILDTNAGTKSIYQQSYDIVEYELSRQRFEIIDLYSEIPSDSLDTLKQSSSDLIHANSRGHSVIAARLFDSVVNQHAATQ